jgi:hypothetical protein
MSGKPFDSFGSIITTPVMVSNCVLYALSIWIAQGGKLSLRWNGWVPHLMVTNTSGTHHFVYGDFGKNGLFPILFKGYGKVS